MAQYGAPVTDPVLLAKLNSNDDSNSINYGPPVTDPDLLAKLNAPSGDDDQLDTGSKGLGGIAADALSGGLNSLANIPSDLVSLPGEISGVAKQAIPNPENPDSRLQENLLAGFGKLGHAALSTPGDIRDYLVKKDLVSSMSPSFRLPESILPKDYDYATQLGIKGQQPGDALLQNLPTMTALSPLGEVAGSGLSKLADYLPVIKPIADKPYKAQNKYIAKNDISQGVPISPTNLEQATKIMKNANIDPEALTSAISKASSGDGQAIHSIQSTLKTIARDKLKVGGVEGDHARNIIVPLANNIVKDTDQYYEDIGHPIASQLRQQGQQRNRLYYKQRPWLLTAAGLGAAAYAPGWVKQLLKKGI